MTSPFLSVVVCSFDMGRELPRTLFSLSPDYQGIPADEYEVVLVDNGSAKPPCAEDFDHLGLDLTVLTTPLASPSPAAAINRGIAVASGEIVCVYIDGARIASPGLLRAAREALAISPRAVVASRGRYLGFAPQRTSIVEGYDQIVEDALLASSGWETDGYRLFAVSIFDESSRDLWTDPIAETNSFFARRTLLAELGGLDERFVTPGGGLVNLDLWARACELPDAQPIVLMGEATFHQIHGGAATTAPEEALEELFAEYERLHGRPYERAEPPLRFWGSFEAPVEASEWTHLDRAPSDATAAPGGDRWSSLLRRLPPRLARRLRNGVGAMHAAVTGRWAARQAFLEHEQAQATLLIESGLFDAGWYADHYPDVVAAGHEPVRHYLRHGRAEKRQPGPGFDGVWYLAANLDLLQVTDLNPLVHFLVHGRAEERWWRWVDPVLMAGTPDGFEADATLVADSDLFDAAWYLARYPDAAVSGLAPHVHYLRLGRAQRRDPGPGFDAQRYLADYADVRANAGNPLVHYLRHGQAEGRVIHPVSTSAAEAP
jgi:hypothetical protein